MAGRSFVDTNVFLYTVDASEPDKRRRAAQVLNTTDNITVSTQVLNEFYYAATRKLKPPLSPSMAGAAVDRLAALPCVVVDADLVRRAIRAGQRWQLSHWDALMVEAARQAGCAVVLTEDLADGADYDGVRIENPFRKPTTSP